MTKKCFVYLTENLVNGKKYIGQHVGHDDDGYLGSGCLLKRAIAKHGKQNFKRVVLEEVESQIELDKAEQKWIAKFDAVNDPWFYNLTDGGTGGDTLRNLTQQQLDHRSAKIKQTMALWSESKQEGNKVARSLAASSVRKTESAEDRANRIAAFKKTVGTKTKEEKDTQYTKIRGSNHYCARKVKTPLGIFDVASDAAKAHSVNLQTVLNRCKHPTNFKDWTFIDG